MSLALSTDLLCTKRGGNSQVLDLTSGSKSLSSQWLGAWWKLPWEHFHMREKPCTSVVQPAFNLGTICAAISFSSLPVIRTFFPALNLWEKSPVWQRKLMQEGIQAWMQGGEEGLKFFFLESSRIRKFQNFFLREKNCAVLTWTVSPGDSNQQTRIRIWTTDYVICFENLLHFELSVQLDVWFPKDFEFSVINLKLST